MQAFWCCRLTANLSGSQSHHHDQLQIDDNVSSQWGFPDSELKCLSTALYVLGCAHVFHFIQVQVALISLIWEVFQSLSLESSYYTHVSIFDCKLYNRVFDRLMICGVAASVPLQRNRRLQLPLDTNSTLVHGELHTTAYHSAEQSERFPTKGIAMCLCNQNAGTVSGTVSQRYETLFVVMVL